MEEVKLHSKEEIEELKKWFDSQELPKSLQLDKATYLPDVKFTVRALLDQINASFGVPQLQGYVVLLMRIKEKLGK